jgi:hypothetical protein
MAYPPGQYPPGQPLPGQTPSGSYPSGPYVCSHVAEVNEINIHLLIILV